MLKRLKSVSMLLFLMGASTGAAYAVANPGVTDVKITQQQWYMYRYRQGCYGRTCHRCICSSERDYEWYYHRT